MCGERTYCCAVIRQIVPFLCSWKSFCAPKPLAAQEIEVKSLSPGSGWRAATYTSSRLAAKRIYSSEELLFVTWAEEARATWPIANVTNQPCRSRSWRDPAAGSASLLASTGYVELIKKTRIAQKFMQYLIQLASFEAAQVSNSLLEQERGACACLLETEGNQTLWIKQPCQNSPGRVWAENASIR